MDKRWLEIMNRANPMYIEGIDKFLEWACSQPGVGKLIRCPCRRCRNTKFKLKNQVREDLLKKGF